MHSTLETTYQKAMEQCRNNIDSVPDSSEGGPANPILIKAPQNYEDSKCKVMYFGQETNGWEGAFRESQGVNHLLGVYDRFANEGGGFRHGGPFWNTLRSFQNALGQIYDAPTFIYNNVIKIGKDYSKGMPSAEVLEWQDVWFEVIRHEVRTFAPDLIFFFTGPKYDWILRRIFPDVSFDAFDGFSERQLSFVRSESLPALSFRSYHPNYLYKGKLLHRTREAIFNEISANKTLHPTAGNAPV